MRIDFLKFYTSQVICHSSDVSDFISRNDRDVSCYTGSCELYGEPDLSWQTRRRVFEIVFEF